jgi:hypothetical protein
LGLEAQEVLFKQQTTQTEMQQAMDKIVPLELLVGHVWALAAVGAVQRTGRLELRAAEMQNIPVALLSLTEQVA